MALNLRSKVVLITVAILFGVLSATSLVSGIIFSREYSAALESRAFVIGHTLKLQLDRLLRLHIPLEDLIGFDEQCREIVEHYPDISFARVVDSRGKILFHNNPLEHARLIPDSRLVQDIRSRRKISGVYKADGDEVFSILIPVEGEAGNTLTAVNIGFSTDLISRKVKGMIGYSVAAATLFFGLGLVSLMFLLNRWVTQPLKRLLDVIEDILRTGVDSMRVVQTHSRDEIGRLASAFNRMILELKSSHRQVRTYAGELENKVRQRTAELEEANRKLEVDLEERRKIEKALQEREEVLRNGFNAIQHGITVLDRNLNIVRVNAAMERMYAPMMPLEGKKCFQVYHERDVECPWCPSVRAIQTGEPQSEIVPYQVQGKAAGWLELSVYPLKDSEENVTGVIEFVKDITEKRKSQEERQRLEAALQQAQKMESIGTLAGGIAHDFNNLLSVIIGNAELAQMSLGGHPESEMLGEIQKAGQRAGELTRQILAFSRKQIIQPEVLNLNDILQSTRKMIGRLIGENIDLVTLPAPDLKNVKADPGQMEQVILNLAVNARDAMPGGGRLSIETANADPGKGSNGKHLEVEPGSYVVLTVWDTGTGMDEETRAHIFEPFFTTKEPGKGTGMGLATVYGIVKQHGGNIYVYSEPGQGTIFEIYLPCLEGASETAPKKEESVTERAGGGETILVVEDDRMLRDMTRRVLLRHGYRVLEAQNGEEALQISSTNEGHIHLVLTDVIMPGMNVREMANKIQQMRKGTKILYVSGYTDDAIARYGVLEEGIEFIGKPFTSGEIIQKIRRVLDSAAITNTAPGGL